MSYALEEQIKIHSFVCFHCGNEYKPRATKNGFEMIEQDLCNKCLAIQKKINKLHKQKFELTCKLTNLEFIYFCRNGYK